MTLCPFALRWNTNGCYRPGHTLHVFKCFQAPKHPMWHVWFVLFTRIAFHVAGLQNKKLLRACIWSRHQLLHMYIGQCLLKPHSPPILPSSLTILSLSLYLLSLPLIFLSLPFSLGFWCAVQALRKCSYFHTGACSQWSLEFDQIYDLQFRYWKETHTEENTCTSLSLTQNFIHGFNKSQIVTHCPHCGYGFLLGTEHQRAIEYWKPTSHFPCQGQLQTTLSSRGISSIIYIQRQASEITAKRSANIMKGR